MDPRLQKRIMLFYVGGVINAFLGLYLLVEGAPGISRETANWLMLLFFGFAAVDFWFPRVLRKRWEQVQAKNAAPPGPVTKM